MPRRARVAGSAAATPHLQVERRGLIDDSGQPIIDPDREKKTSRQGAATIGFGAISPLLADIGGVCLKDNDIGPLDDDPAPITFGSGKIVSSDVVPHAIDPNSARRLWELSEQLL